MKVLLYNGVSLFVTELALSGLLMGLSEGLYRQAFMVTAILMFFLILMAGLESAVHSVMGL